MKFRAAVIGLVLTGNVLATAAGCAARNDAEPSPLSPSGSSVASNSAPTPQNPAAQPPRKESPTADKPANPPAAPSIASQKDTPEEVVATVSDTVITRDQLHRVLLEAYGLNMLAKVAQLELARTEAKRNGIVVTPADVTAETERYLTSLFNEEKDPQLQALNEQIDQAIAAKDTARAEALRGDLRRERYALLDQLLKQQHVTRADFELVMETNTILRKLAESLLKKQPVTDAMLMAAFNHQYGEKVQVRHIQVASHPEANEVKTRLANGEDFAKLARELSRNPNSAPLGGEIPPFSRDTPGYPQTFKDVAFALKVGEVSDTVVLGQEYHIVKLEGRIPPRVVKFEDVKEGVREFLMDRQLEAGTKELRDKLQKDVTMFLKINDPVLQKQFDQQVNRRDEEIRDRNDVRRELDRRLQQLQTTRPTTQPTTVPATKPTTMPATNQLP